jgi:Rrf2 family protein
MLSTKVRYATRIMVYLASREDLSPATKHEISEAEGITPDYIEQIMILLKSGGVVKSFRGRNGGFALTRTPEQITLLDILTAVEGPICPAPCIHDESCHRRSQCTTRHVWQQATNMLEGLFSQTTLLETVEKSNACKSAVPLTYTI